MKHYESIIIGHVTMDHDTDYLGNETFAIGGAVIYSSASAYALGHKVAAVTKINPADSERLKYFTVPKEDLYCIESESSCTLENQYFTADKERRKCSWVSVGTPFTIADIPEGIDADIYHFAGLLYGDFSNEMIVEASKLGKVAVDVQALLRHPNMEDHTMYFEDWKEKKEILPYIDFLKTDAAEAEILTGLTDRYEAAKLLYSWGAKEVIITHNTEVIVYDGKDFCSVPIRARNLSGRTGRGDTTFAAYMTERLTHSIKDSLLYATATVSNKMEIPGPYKATRADVEKYIDEFYSDIK